MQVDDCVLYQSIYFFYNFTCTSLGATVFGNMVTPSQLVIWNLAIIIGPMTHSHYYPDLDSCIYSMHLGQFR